MAPAPDPRASALQRLDRLARLLDSSIRVPGTRWRVGLDPLIGLVPGVGDAAGVLLSAYIVLQAARLRVGGPTLLRMAANVGLEALVGAVPLLGDLFDAAFKANQRNVRLLRAHLAEPAAAARRSRRWLAAAMLTMLLAVGLATGLGVWVVTAALRALLG